MIFAIQYMLCILHYHSFFHFFVCGLPYITGEVRFESKMEKGYQRVWTSTLKKHLWNCNVSRVIWLLNIDVKSIYHNFVNNVRLILCHRRIGFESETRRGGGGQTSSESVTFHLISGCKPQSYIKTFRQKAFLCAFHTTGNVRVHSSLHKT